MQLKDHVKIAGWPRIEIFKAASVKRGPDGDIIEGELLRVIEQKNMIVDTGLDFITYAISRSTTPMAYIAAGDGSTAADHADTTLESELGRVATIGYDDTSPGIIRFRAIFESNQANGNIQEFGIFNDATAGTMFCRSVLGSSFTKDTSILVRVYWTLTFTDA